MKNLRETRLWPGSSLEAKDRWGGGLTRADLEAKEAALSKCDDRTPAEEEFLTAIRNELIATPKA